MKYIYISPARGIEVIEQAQKPTLRELRVAVGRLGEEAFIENLQLCFSDRSIIILCDDERDAKGLPLVAISPVGDRLRGNVIIMGSRYTDHELDYIELTDAQIAIVLNEITIAEWH